MIIANSIAHVPSSNAFRSGISGFRDILNAFENKAMMSQIAPESVNLPDLIDATSKAELCVKLASQLSSKAIEAYKQIMSIQV